MPSAANEVPETHDAYRQRADEVLGALRSDARRGLPPDEAAARLTRDGRNDAFRYERRIRIRETSTIRERISGFVLACAPRECEHPSPSETDARR